MCQNNQKFHKSCQCYREEALCLSQCLIASQTLTKRKMRSEWEKYFEMLCHWKIRVCQRNCYEVLFLRTKENIWSHKKNICEECHTQNRLNWGNSAQFDSLLARMCKCNVWLPISQSKAENRRITTHSPSLWSQFLIARMTQSLAEFANSLISFRGNKVSLCNRMFALKVSRWIGGEWTQCLLAWVKVLL